MVRVAFIASLSTLMAVPAAGQTPGKSDSWRIRELPAVENWYVPLPATDVGPQGQFGLGRFGLKKERSFQSRATGRELSAPKSSRLGIGYSLKF